jgi:hypothetical protein
MASATTKLRDRRWCAASRSSRFRSAGGREMVVIVEAMLVKLIVLNNPVHC